MHEYELKTKPPFHKMQKNSEYAFMMSSLIELILTKIHSMLSRTSELCCSNDSILSREQDTELVSQFAENNVAFLPWRMTCDSKIQTVKNNNLLALYIINNILIYRRPRSCTMHSVSLYNVDLAQSDRVLNFNIQQSRCDINYHLSVIQSLSSTCMASVPPAALSTHASTRHYNWTRWNKLRYITNTIHYLY